MFVNMKNHTNSSWNIHTHENMSALKNRNIILTFSFLAGISSHFASLQTESLVGSLWPLSHSGIKHSAFDSVLIPPNVSQVVVFFHHSLQIFSIFSIFFLSASSCRVFSSCSPLWGARWLSTRAGRTKTDRNKGSLMRHIQGSAHTDVHAHIENDKSFLKNRFLSCAPLLLYALIVLKVETHMQINITSHKQFLIFLMKWNCVENIKISKSFPE